ASGENSDGDRSKNGGLLRETRERVRPVLFGCSSSRWTARRGAHLHRAGLSSLARRNHQNSFPIHRNKDVLVSRVHGNRVNTRALDRNIGNEFFGRSVDHSYGASA